MEINFEKINENHKKIIEIFNYYIKTGTAAFPNRALPESFFPIFLEKMNNYPAYSIINSKNQEVIGFCFLNAYHEFQTFKETATVSYFIAPEYTGEGIGTKCLKKLEEDAAQIGITCLIAEISSENTQSLKFHEKHGFIIAGTLRNIGSKFQRRFDVVYMQKELCGLV